MPEEVCGIPVKQCDRIVSQIVESHVGALFFGTQPGRMGIVRAYPEEFRPVPATEITLSENKTKSDSLVGASRTVIQPI
ncbi:hypothetical protein H6G96_11215 [Nostoc sp. FACHB-892]|uniref:hypothetical protein n=1 Tax=Nostoc sp. FACHB-892 TaxID=2692843 RepID=UPI0016832FE2|nr:hypothetical protein [Nostoc sp. FACHB-892]MBD2726885.1 hypothetical protein [Nostoc sp. FACHB-892]